MILTMNKKGFTLIEIVTVIFLVSVISTFFLGLYDQSNSSLIRNDQSTLTRNIDKMSNFIEFENWKDNSSAYLNFKVDSQKMSLEKNDISLISFDFNDLKNYKMISNEINIVYNDFNLCQAKDGSDNKVLFEDSQGSQLELSVNLENCYLELIKL